MELPTVRHMFSNSGKTAEGGYYPPRRGVGPDRWPGREGGAAIRGTDRTPRDHPQDLFSRTPTDQCSAPVPGVSGADRCLR